MRRAFAAPLAFLLLVATPLGSAHGDPAQTHLSVKPLQLAPGEAWSVGIQPGTEAEGPWRTGMVFVLYVLFANQTRDLQVDLVYGHSETVQSWRLRDTDAHHLSTRIPKDLGPYELSFRNLNTTATTQLWFYFDQACNCVEKLITIPKGWVVFDYDLEARREYFIGYPLVQGWAVNGTLARLRDDVAAWPGSFETVQATKASGPAWVNFTFTPRESGPYYVFLFAEAMPMDCAEPRPFCAMQMTVLVEDHGEKNGLAGPSLPLLLAAFGACLVGLRRTRTPLSD